MANKADYEKLIWWIAKFHSILNTAWPKPSERALAGASAFIGTTLFKALENSLPIITETLENSNNKHLKAELTPFWNALRNLFFAIGRQDRNVNNDQVDFAFNLLYLASGVFYYRLEQLSFTHPDLRKEYMEVEPFDKLLNLCQWPGKADNVKSVFDSLAPEMMSCAKDFK